MKPLLLQYATYNLWANKLMVDRLVQLPKDILNKENGNSFGSIYKTLVHMLEVESIWWQRMKLLERIILPESDPEEDIVTAGKLLIQSSKDWQNWVSETNEKYLTHVFGYQNSYKELFKQPVYEMLLHLFNHQSYHRGQLVTMLRQEGINKIPKTDFIFFTRKK